MVASATGLDRPRRHLHRRRMTRTQYDLVLRWPREAGAIQKLERMATFPLARQPKHIDPADGDVWVAVAGNLAARFRTRGISGPRAVTLLNGNRALAGYRLQLEPGSVRLLGRPIPMAAVPGGSQHAFPHPEGMRYLHRRPRRFVRLSDPSSSSREPKERLLEVRTAQEWLAQTKAAPADAEIIRHPAEGRLVAAYASWRRARAGRDVLVRHELRTPAGGVLLTDAFDTAKKVLLEAKATTERPAIRMAIGQLLDYSLWAPKHKSLAILVPRMPSDDLIKVAALAKIEVVWQLPSGDFDDTAGGALST